MAVFGEYTQHDALGLAELVRAGEVAATDLVDAAAERIEQLDPTLNAVVWSLVDQARDRAAAAPVDGPFAGVPTLLKDLGLAYDGVPLTNGSRSLAGFVPDYTATLFQRYEAAGLLPVGKSNTPEFGAAPVTEPELHGPTRNPWNTELTPGGSSGGSAAAVAAGMVPLAHASDGGGSIRIPASHCGLFGLKPTRGRTPSGPVIGESWFGFSIAHAVTRTVRDSAALLDVSAGPEPGDPYAAPPPERPYLEELGRDPGRLRIGLVDGAILPAGEVHPECRRAARDAAALCEELGHDVVGVELPVDGATLTEAFLTLVAADAAHGIRMAAESAGKDEPDPDDYELATWVVGLVGRALTAEDVAEALFEARTAGRQMGEVFTQLDVVVSPTMARPPWPLGELDPSPVEEQILRGLRRAPVKPALLAVFRQLAGTLLDPIPNTPLYNMTGQPAMSVPLHWTADGLPVGVQFAGRFGDEATLFRLAAQLEEARPWFDRRPPLSTGS